MSYHTLAEIRMFVDGEDLAQYEPEPGDEIEKALNVAKAYLEPLEYSAQDVLDGLRQAMRDGRGDFGNMFHEDFEKILIYVSSQFPVATFRLRCFGAEFADVYLREFKAGKITLSVGPFPA